MVSKLRRPTKTKVLSDAEYIASLENLHGMEALREFESSEFSNTSDPYYRDLNAALWKMFSRALKEIEEEKEQAVKDALLDFAEGN